MTPIKFKSNLREVSRGLDRMSERIVEELAEEAVRVAKRRIARDSGKTAAAIDYEIVSKTLARVGTTRGADPEKVGLWLEIRDAFRGRYSWLGPSLDETETRAKIIARAIAKSEAARIAAKTR